MPMTEFGAISTLVVHRLFDIALETKDVSVHTAAVAIARDPEHWDDHVIYLARIQAEAKKEMFDRLTKLVERGVDPPIILMTKDQLRGSLRPGDVALAHPSGVPEIVSEDEWPLTERAVIAGSDRVYFRDFLRSAWRRLTARLASW